MGDCLLTNKPSWLRLKITRSHRSGWSPSNFGMNLISPETRMMGLPYGEESVIIGRTMWTQFTSVTDGQTDIQNYDPKDRATQSVARQKSKQLITWSVSTYGYLHNIEIWVQNKYKKNRIKSRVNKQTPTGFTWKMTIEFCTSRE